MWMCLRSEFSLIPFSDRAKQHKSKAGIFYSAPLHCQAESCWAEPKCEQFLHEEQHKKALAVTHQCKDLLCQILTNSPSSQARTLKVDSSSSNSLGGEEIP